MSEGTYLKLREPTRWICPKGHISEGVGEAFRIRAVSAHISVEQADTGNICPVCYVLWIADHVPKVERVFREDEGLRGEK